MQLKMYINIRSKFKTLYNRNMFVYLYVRFINSVDREIQMKMSVHAMKRDCPCLCFAGKS